MIFDSVHALLDAIRRNRLLSTAQINEVKSVLLPRTDDDPETLVSLLVHHGYLTPYQAENLTSNSDEPLVLGSYRILDLLGEGGLCKVYKALHVDFQQIVALKIVHPELRSNIEVVDQFRTEIEMVAQIEHPKFVKALDFHLDGDVHFFAMEYVEGLDLMRLVQQAGALPAHQACDYIHQAALGLQYAFEQGLVHRDVKPANLIVSFEGEQVYVLDIGLARLEWSYRDAGNTFTPATQGVALMGTPDYVAPEQAMNPHAADVLADIYSLGCTLYHLLAGQPPFPGGSLARKLLHHQTTPSPSIRTLKPETPPDLAVFIQKMMSKQPAERPRTPAAVAVALSPFLQGTAPRIKLDQFRPIPLVIEPPPAAPAPPPRPPSGQAPGAAAKYGQPGAPPERRTNTRFATYPTSVHVCADPNAEEPLRAWLLNRSLGGFGLMVEEALEIGTDVWVRPAAELYQECWIPMRIIYCNPERLRWRVGCQFLEPMSWDSLRIFG